MKKIAFLFPGQGSQVVGMGREVAEHNGAAATLMMKADGILGIPLSSICFEGPEEELKRTENTQPALFATSAATLAVLRAGGVEPFAVAGHSLGEYTALHAAGVFDFEAGLKLVRIRGNAFAEAGDKRPGAMAAIIGLEGEQVKAICQEVSATGNGIVVPANYNDPTQTVISGDPFAVDHASTKCKEAGAKRAMRLPVSGAFHSPLVEPASATMDSALHSVTLHKPSCHFVSNVHADDISEPFQIRKGLVEQVTHSVRWVESVKKLESLGVEAFIEVGSGKVLCGLVKRIVKDIPAFSTESWDSLIKTIEAVKA